MAFLRERSLPYVFADLRMFNHRFVDYILPTLQHYEILVKLCSFVFDFITKLIIMIIILFVVFSGREECNDGCPRLIVSPIVLRGNKYIF